MIICLNFVWALVHAGDCQFDSKDEVFKKGEHISVDYELSTDPDLSSPGKKSGQNVFNPSNEINVGLWESYCFYIFQFCFHEYKSNFERIKYTALYGNILKFKCTQNCKFNHLLYNVLNF